MSQYVIKLKEQPLIQFTIERTPFGEYFISNEVYLTNNMNLLPQGVQYGVLHWLTSRVIPKNRQNVKDILGVLGLKWHPLEIINVSYGLSLIDAYWVCPLDSTVRFKDINLFENDFSDILGVVAFTGYKSKIGNFRTSPELSTDGMLPKCWRKEEDGIVLYKGGTSGASNSGLEPYSEYYAYQIAKRMGLNAVPYTLKRYKNKLVSVCPLFTTLNSYYVPMHLIANLKGLEDIRNIYGIQAFSDLCAFDYIISNTDRHLGNFGMLVNQDGAFISPAPIFDNGLGLFPYLVKSDFELGVENSMYANVSALTDDLPYLVKTVLTRETKEKVRRLINFKFERHNTYNLPEWRLKGLEGYIAKQVASILTLKENF